MSDAFFFRGPLPPSKSILIRYLLLQGYAPDLQPPWLSACDDVQVMQAAIAALTARPSPSAATTPIVEADCGEAGLVLRLCLAFAARRGGRYLLRGSPRLLARPHGPLLQALRMLGSQIEQASDGTGLTVDSPQGFQAPPQPLSLLGGSSSQFASALVLNAWDLPFALDIDIDPKPVSAGYLTMSLHIAQQLGMTVQRTKTGRLHIPAGQRLQVRPTLAEADVSSALAVVAIAAVAGSAHITNFPLRSLQPDVRFLELLSMMGVRLRLDDDGLRVEQPVRRALRPILTSVADCPDVVPVLAVLCSLAEGESLLHGAPHLRGKESDRIAETAALLRLLGREVAELSDGLRICGRPLDQADRAPRRSYHPGRDHRLVMAAAVARWAGFAIEIHGQEAVDKSFPEFRQIALGA